MRKPCLYRRKKPGYARQGGITEKPGLVLESLLVEQYSDRNKQEGQGYIGHQCTEKQGEATRRQF